MISQDIDAGIDWYGRVKTNHSASRKMLRDNLSAHEILDIIGIRAITEHVDDCYRLIRRIHSQFLVQGGEFVRTRRSSWAPSSRQRHAARHAARPPSIAALPRLVEIAYVAA